MTPDEAEKALAAAAGVGETAWVAGESEADIILLTHRTIERNMDAAIASIEALPTVSGRVARLRLEEL